MKVLHTSHRSIELKRPMLMGIINMTPDSFVAASRRASVEEAVACAKAMVAEGATLLDIGGESTRPYATPVSAEEECARILPAIEAIHVALPTVILSVDTYKTAVAREALRAGAEIINDVHGCQPDEGMWELVRDTGAGYVVMHSRGNAQTMEHCCTYHDVVDEVYTALTAAASQLEAMGVAQEQLLLDVGFGFAKRPDDCLALMAATERFAALPYGLLAGVSKKRFLQSLETTEDPTVVAACQLATHGTNILRVHDIAPLAVALGQREKEGQHV